MKTLLTILAITLTLTVAGKAFQSSNNEQDHSACLTTEDVMWHSDRSKSGIPRTCTASVLKNNLSKGNGQ